MQVKEKKAPKLRNILQKSLHTWSGIGHFLAAFLLADACLLESIRPFGLCYGLTLEEKDRLWGCSGAFLGSLMIAGPRGGAIYGAAAIVALTADTVLLRESRAREIFLPLLLAGVIALIKLPFALMEGLGSVGLLMVEVLLTAMASYCLLLPKEGAQGSIRRGVLSVMAIVAMADLRILELISPSCAAALLLTALLSYGSLPKEGERQIDLTGAAFGLVIGAFLDMACDGAPFYAAVFGLSAVLTCCLPARSRIAFSITFLLTGLSALLWSFGDGRAMGCVYDLFIAVSLFLLLPEEWVAAVVWQRSRTDGYASAQTAEGTALRLHGLGEAIAALTDSVWEPEEGEEGLGTIFDHVAAELCRTCRRAGICWMEEYQSTVGAFNDLLPGLRRKGHIAPEELGGGLRGCTDPNGLCAAINREYMSWLRRRAERRERKLHRDLLRAQYAGLGAAVDSVAAAVREEYVHKPMAERQVAGILSAYRKGLHTEVWRGGGRLHISIGPFMPDTQWPEEEAFLRSAEGALGCRFLPAERVCGKTGEQYLYKEKEHLAVTLSAAVRRKKGEEVCGDSYIFFHTEDGRAIILLSDGMGTGREASRLSRNTVELVAAFVRSGCSLTESACAVIPFLQGRWSAGFATLDLLEIDLFSGAAKLIKCGAADSFLVEGGMVRSLSMVSLPPGADPEGGEGPKGIDFLLRPGCRMIMASDGAELTDPDLLCRSGLTAGELAAACGRDGRDDLTILVLSICEADCKEEG
ncbi:MAG: SpoIIE family protein phosphatase [Clostridia bacterium]|nr:SpoIIE family protein phosphatase [Clostridia bacterium]